MTCPCPSSCHVLYKCRTRTRRKLLLLREVSIHEWASTLYALSSLSLGWSGGHTHTAERCIIPAQLACMPACPLLCAGLNMVVRRCNFLPFRNVTCCFYFGKRHCSGESAASSFTSFGVKNSANCIYLE